jgi:hypothetical protein
MPKLKLSIFASLSIFLTGPPCAGFELNVNADSVLHDLKSGEKRELRAGTPFSVNEKNPLWISAQGRIPVLVVPLAAQGSQVSVESPRAEQVFKEEKDLKIDDTLSEVMLYFSEIHRLIAQRNLPVAAQKVTELRTKYPNVKFVNFIEGSVAFLNGDRDKALSLINAGLTAHPSYEPGIEMKKKLEGAKP